MSTLTNKFKSIKYKLLAFSIIMSLLPLLILGGYNLMQAKNYLWDSIKYQHSYATAKVVGEINLLLDEAERVLTFLANANETTLSSNNLKEQERLLYSCLTNLPYAEKIILINGEGEKKTEVSRLDVNQPGTFQNSEDKNMESILASISDYQTYFSPVFVDNYGQSYFQLAVPLIKNGNKIEGAIIANISLRSIVNLLSKVSGTTGAYIFLVDQSGKLVGHEDFSQVLKDRNVKASLPALSASEEQQTGENPLVRIYQSYTGEEVVGAYTKVEGTDWAVIYEQPTDKAFASYFSLQKTFIFSTVILILAVLAISLFFIIRFIRELEKLKKGVKRITSGEIGFALPINNQDEIGEVLGAINELSQELKRKREIEGALRQTDKMASIGLLAAGVAHEINNPLATICLCVDELRYELKNISQQPQDKNENLDRYLDIINKHAERCSQITQDLLNFARGGSNPEKTSEPYNLNELLKRAVTLSHYTLKKKSIEIEYDLDPSLPLLWGDEAGIQQVLFNLLNNSAQAICEKNKGLIKLVTKNMDDYALVKVVDNGMGIPEENLEHIFEPFFTTKPRGQGTGLGLAVSYGLIQQANGTISLESESGKGTAVSIKLPYRKGEINDENLNCGG